MEYELTDLKVINNTLSARQANDFRLIPYELKANGELLCYVDCKRSSKELRELEILTNYTLKLKIIDPDIFNKILDKNFIVSKTRKLKTNSFNNLLEEIIATAHHLNSSDIHFEVFKNNTRVRFRRDGKLKEYYVIDKEEYPAIINKIKIKAQLDIAEKRLPQDGRISYVNELGEEIDIRISSLPTLHGEKLVLRLLNNNKKSLSLKTLGIDTEQLIAYREILKLNQGLILISGPTGSGKTTTLYASLGELNKIDKNIITIEDPIEYTLNGINQVQLKEEIGLSFPKALKAFLRQDPDIIMVGEIRDAKTAQMAIRASLTGHLVFATLHTNSAWASLTRLKDMGIPDYLIMETLKLSIAQRLVRKLCCECKERSNSTTENLKKYFQDHYTSNGCKACHYTGYEGRTAIYEFIPVTNTLKGFFENDPNDFESFKNENPYKSLKESALSLVKQGITSIDEVFSLIALQ